MADKRSKPGNGTGRTPTYQTAYHGGDKTNPLSNLARIIVEKFDKRRVPETTIDTIPFDQIYPDGLCMIGNNFYSRMVQFYDINYQLAQNDEKQHIFGEYCQFLNYFDETIHFQFCFINQRVDMEEYKKVITIPEQDDEFNVVRREYATYLRNQLEKGNNGIVKSKYLIFGIEARDRKQAVSRLAKIESDVINKFKLLGCKCVPVNGLERLRIMHDYLNQDSLEKFAMKSFKDVAESGLTPKNFITPTSFDFRAKDYYKIPEVYEGEMPELFARQILAMTTGHDTDGNIIADAGEHKFRPEYAVETYNDNPDDYAEVAKGVTFTTIYGDVQLDSVSQYDVGRFNLTEEQFTGTLLEGKGGLDKGQKIVFEKEDIMAVHVDYRDIDVRADTSLMNEAYADRKTEMENPEHDRTYRCYVDGDKSSFDVCLFKDDDGKKHFYIEDTADYPLITGELQKETEFTPGTAVSLMNDMGECYDGSREFIVYDVHMPERTEELMDKSRKEELFPTALFVSEIWEHGTSIHRYDCCDDFNAKAFGESIKDRNEEHGIRTMTSVAMKKQPEKVHEVSKSQQDVVETFRAKTRDLFHELDGQNAESIESMVRGHVEDALQTFDIDAQVVDVVLVGSRCRGIEHEDSDVDVVVEYYGSEREDSLFNILNEEGLSIGGRNIDINPITKDRSGTLETYLPEVEKYLAEKAQSMEQPSRDMAGEVAKEQEAKDKREQEKAKKGRPEKHKTGKFANFSMQKSDESEKYYLYADIKYPSGDIERHKPIAEFPDKKQAEEFCKSRGITCDDVTDNLENVIRHKKHMANDKGTQPPSRENGRKRSDIGDE